MEGLETRKLVKLGKSSIVVSLPKGWVEVMGLEKGNEVQIQRLGDGSLKIIPSGVTPSRGRKIRVDISKIRRETLLERLLMAYYLEGAEEISFISSENNLEKLREIAENFLSLIGEGEIKEREGELILLVDSKTEKFSMDQLISEMMGGLLNIFSNLRNLIKTGNSTKKEELLRYERKIDTLYKFALRKLIKAQGNRGMVKSIGLRSPSWILGDRLVIKTIEQTADILTKSVDMAASLVESGIKKETSKKLFSYIEEIEDIIPEIINSFREHDSLLADTLFGKIEEIQSKLQDLEEEGNVVYSEFLTRLNLSLEPFFGTLEVVFNRSASEEPKIEGIEAIELESIE